MRGGMKRSGLRLLNFVSRKTTSLADRTRVPSFLTPNRLFSWLYDLEYESRVGLQRLTARTSAGIREASEVVSGRDLHIIDVGARGGLLPVFTHLQSLATWTLFEPELREYRRLTRRYRAHRNITVEPLAVAATSREVELFESLKRGVSSTLYPIYGGRFRVTSTRRVAAISIGEYCAKRGITPNVLKLDTQGSELEIVKSLGETRPEVIWTEIQGPSQYVGATSPVTIEEYLVALGYTLLSTHGSDYLFGFGTRKDDIVQRTFLLLFELQRSELG